MNVRDVTYAAPTFTPSRLVWSTLHATLPPAAADGSAPDAGRAVWTGNTRPHRSTRYCSYIQSLLLRAEWEVAGREVVVVGRGGALRRAEAEEAEEEGREVAAPDVCTEEEEVSEERDEREVRVRR
jgi:hypothetical protein